MSNKISLPEAIEKSLEDQFDYALGLSNGKVFRFSNSRIVNNDFLYLNIHDTESRSGNFFFDRGVEVRISDITWAADAPMGS